jgi:hypothetical protein
MTALADFPVAQTRPRTYRGPGSLGPGPAPVPDADLAADRSGTVRDHAVLAAAGPRRPRRGRSMVRLGRHRAEDRLRHGVPPARHLVLASPGHSRHPAGRRQALRRLRAARLARHRPRDQRPDPPVREAVSGSSPSRSAWPGRWRSTSWTRTRSPRRPGPSPPWCPASRSWSWAWGPPSPTCCARTPQQPTAHRRTLPDQPLARDRRNAPQSNPGTSQTRIRRTGPPPSPARRALPRHRPGMTAMPGLNSCHPSSRCRAGYRPRPRRRPRPCPGRPARLPAGATQPRGQRLERGA